MEERKIDTRQRRGQSLSHYLFPYQTFDNTRYIVIIFERLICTREVVNSSIDIINLQLPLFIRFVLFNQDLIRLWNLYLVSAVIFNNR